MSCEASVKDAEASGAATNRLLASVLIVVGVLGVCLNALVIAGVRQAVPMKATKSLKVVFIYSLFF
jgi:hypothetical protein